MSIRSRLRSLTLCCLAISWCSIFAQVPASPEKRFSDLQARYERHTLNDTAYLNGVDSIAPLLLSDDSLKQLLSTYQQIAFGNQALGKYRVMYYRCLAVNSINRNKYGSAIYYAGKVNEEAIKIGRFEKEGIPHSDLFSISIYLMNRDYARVVSEYDTLRPGILKLPAAIRSGKVSPEQAYVALNLLQVAVTVLYKTKDTVHANEGVLVCEKMVREINKQPATFKKDTTLYNWIYHSMLFEKEKHLAHFDRAQDFLQTAIHEVLSKNFRPYLQSSCLYDTYTDAFDFYFDHGRKDSARHYLSLVQDINDSILPYSYVKQSFLREGNSKLLAGSGHFEAAYHELRKLYQITDSAFYAVSADKDNNLYAMAKEENMGNELFRMEATKQKTERFNLVLFLLLALLLLAAVIVFSIYRSKQRQRLLNLRLSLARNFHDEIGPLLLYANTLAKKEGETNHSTGLEELKAQIAHIMEGVRSISHDLKSSELSTVGSFCKEVTGLLEKIKTATRIDFKVRVGSGNRVLSHYQYTHLRKITNELISNSIKHAGCRLIDIYVQVTERNVVIHYSDDGKGMAPSAQSGGIGMQNIEERAGLLNGTFQLHNAYPEGYSIDISIPLV